MNFNPDWKHLPSLDTDLFHPFTGIKPIVSGLPYGSLNAAQNRVTQIICKLQCLDPDILSVDIASSSSTDPLSYVWAPLSTIKEVPRLDILQRVRPTPGRQEGLCTLWKVCK